MLKFSKILFLPQFPKCSIHLTSVVLDDFYSILGVNPKSTQAQIKEAYYKLSKMYHPDMNQDEEALKKFREVNQAYEVLSNLKTKKLYDKGVIRGINDEIKKEETPEEKFYRSLEKKHKVPAYGKTTIYDFDKWTQEHYSETFVTEREFKNNKTRNRVLSENVSKDDSNIVLMGFAMFAVVSFFLLFDFIDHINHEYKKPVK